MTTEPPAETGFAFARAALAGNPSDGYGGAVLALALPAWRATAQARRATARARRATAQARRATAPARQATARARRATAPAQRATAPAIDPPSQLVEATVARFGSVHPPAAREATAITWETTIPRAVGLGGSSAIVVAVLRALSALWSITLEPLAMAQLALSIEVDDLGIAAGLQDRIAQTHDGLTFMDFGSEPPTVRTLDPALLPPLLVAWRTDSGGHSGEVHAPLRDRHAAGEPVVRTAMRTLTGAAHGAERAIATGDHAALCAAVDASFDARRSMLALDPRHVEMIEAARAAGAAANYAGSGGAIVAVCRDAEHSGRVRDALRELGCEALAADDLRLTRLRDGRQ